MARLDRVDMDTHRRNDKCEPLANLSLVQQLFFELFKLFA